MKRTTTKRLFAALLVLSLFAAAFTVPAMASNALQTGKLSGNKGTLQISFEKVWEDDGYELYRPKKLRVSLYRGDEKILTKTVSEKSGWKCTFDISGVELVDERGEAYVFSVKEETVSNYRETAHEDPAVLFTPVNGSTYVNVTPAEEISLKRDDGTAANLVASKKAGSNEVILWTQEALSKGERKAVFRAVKESSGFEDAEYSRCTFISGSAGTYRKGKKTSGFTVTSAAISYNDPAAWEKVLLGSYAKASAKALSASIEDEIDITEDMKNPKLRVTLLDEENAPVSGAVFTLTRGSESIGEPRETAEDGTLYFELPMVEATYTLTETGVPEGYSAGNDSYMFKVVLKKGIPEIRMTGNRLFKKIFGKAPGFSKEDASAEYVLTMENESEHIDIPVTLIWDDEEDRDGLRPESVTVTLFADGEKVDSAKIKAGRKEDWSHTFEGLKRYGNGAEIVYTVTAAGASGYTADRTEGSSAEGFKITEKHTPEQTKVDVTVQWDDAENQDRKRPQAVTVHVLNDGEEITSAEVTSDAQGVWQHTFEGLDRYEAGKEIKYTIDEATVELYETSIDGFTITNKHATEKISIEGRKTWVDDENNDGLRPETITIELLAGGTKIDEKIVKESDDWAWSFDGYEKYSAGEEIVYTVRENEVEGYTAKVRGYDVTNTHIREKTLIEGKLTWIDDDDNDNVRPEAVTVYLLANGIRVASQSVSAEEEWSWQFTGFDRYSAGEEITYTIEEEEVGGYTSEVTGYDITNTHKKEVTQIKVTKVWDDHGDTEGLRPSSITVSLYMNGEDTGERATLSAANKDGENWIYTFTGLDLYTKGEKNVYTIEEEAVPNYTASIDQKKYIITNTCNTETRDITVTKTFEQGDSAKSDRPEKTTVDLYANGEHVDSVELSEKNDWTATFTDLPKNKDGEEIVYTAEESGSEKGSGGVSGSMTDGFVFTDSAEFSSDIPDSIGNNASGDDLSDDFVINIYPDEETTKSEEETEKDWNLDFSDTDQDVGGKQNKNQIQEIGVDGIHTIHSEHNAREMEETKAESTTNIAIWIIALLVTGVSLLELILEMKKKKS